MKKYSIAVCVCAVLFSVGIHGGGMREVFARAPGADENLAILQDIIRENECQPEWHFWDIPMKVQRQQRYLNIPDREKWQLRILFYRMEQWLMQGDMKFMPLSRGMIAGSAFIRLSYGRRGISG